MSRTFIFRRTVLIFGLLGLVVSAACPGLAQAPTAAAPVATGVDEQLRSPRATMKNFLRASREFSETDSSQSFDEAAQCLDWSDSTYSDEEKQRLVTQLKGMIDRMAWVDLSTISDLPDAADYHFPPDAVDQPIVISRGSDGAWRFTQETVGRIGALWSSWKDRPLVVAATPWYRRVTIVGNELWRIAALFFSILIGWIVGRVLRMLLNSSAASLEKRNRHYSAVTLQSLAKAVVMAAIAVGLKVGLQFLLMLPVVESIAATVVSILFTLVAAYAVWCLVDVVDAWLKGLAAKTDSKLDDMLAPMIRSSLRVTVVVLTLVQVATVLSDKPMTSIIAGLSVGGLAVGLAAQDLIKNFFGSIMIFSDRPFELGDRIQVDGFDGTIEAVGFRSTRVRTLDGHLVTMPNGELANKSIRNVAKRPNIRRIMNIGVTYDTPPEKVQEAIEIVTDVLEDHEGQAEDMPARVYFNDFMDSSLNLFVIYWYHPASWWEYCAFSEWVNKEILRRFNEAGIEFAFPSRTVYLAGGGNERGAEPAMA